ncbi:uncharacterized protein LOC119107033, partial [Pollicipes pollicipes]|uniref:uncharacterized protein LOC119107033 n=1 Tax=Pollicipes pollicipes TaxID=41117 RepID=UPI0018855997
YDGVLGLDAEWKPITVRDWNRVSLLQVATSRLVYVLDLLQLTVVSPLMERLGAAILCGDNLKLGRWARRAPRAPNLRWLRTASWSHVVRVWCVRLSDPSAGQ